MVKININLSNRVLYTILSLVILVLAGVVVWAAAPNPGHTWGEIGDIPADIADGDQVGVLNWAELIAAGGVPAGLDDGDDVGIASIAAWQTACTDCVTDGDVVNTLTATNYVRKSTWTDHNNYPSACASGKYVSGIGDTLSCSTPAIPINYPQCPPKKIMVYEDGGEEWGEHVRYGSCTPHLCPSGPCVLLGTPAFCNDDEVFYSKGGQCYRLLYDNCPQFCEEFGFRGGSAHDTTSNYKNKFGYRNGATDWTATTEGVHQEVTVCRCYP